MNFIPPVARALASVLILLLLISTPIRSERRGGGASTSQGAAASAIGYHALVIGNNDYKSLPKLKTAEADAREVERLLRDDYGFQTKLLLNATRQQIVSALFSYRQNLGPDANLLVYYAGHGINDKEAEKAYWLPVDASRDDDSNWVSADDITTRLRAIPARHVLVISDSCYSGSLTRGLGDALPQPNGREQFIRRMIAGRSRTLMASGGDEPVADGGGGGRHSVFASALLKGLRGMDKAMFTAAELFRYYVEEPVAGRAQQTPEYSPIRNSGHEAGDFVFIRVKANGKNVEVPVKVPPATAIDPAAVELSFWDTIKASTDPEDFREYLTRYPKGQFAGLAQRRVTTLAVGVSAVPAAAPARRTVEAAILEAERLLYARDWAGALRAADEAIALAPSSGRAHRHRGQAYLYAGEEDKGRADAERVLELLVSPRDAGEYEARGWAYNMRADYARAVADYTQALTRNPKYALAYIGRGTSYSNLGTSSSSNEDYNSAIDDFTQAISLSPESYIAYFSRGWVYMLKRDYNSAIADYTQVITLDPTYIAAYHNRGIAYGQKNDYRSAVADFTQAISLNPKDPYTYRRRAFAYQQLGDAAKAQADRNKAAELTKK